MGCFIAFSAFLQALTVCLAWYGYLADIAEEFPLLSQWFPVRIGAFKSPKLWRFLWILTNEARAHMNYLLTPGYGWCVGNGTQTFQYEG